SEKEKFFIESSYYLGRGQWQKAIQNAEVYKQTYVREAAAYNALAFPYGLLGDFEKAAENFAEAIRLDPDTWNHHVGLGLGWMMLGTSPGVAWKESGMRQASIMSCRALPRLKETGRRPKKKLA